jgi:hypothetical protein
VPSLRSICLAALLAGCQLCAAAAVGGVITIAEGKAVVYRSLGRFQAAEGVRLQADDLVYTGKDTFLQVEFDDGATIDLGPDTSIQLNGPTQRKGDRPGLYLLSGWIKVTDAPGGAAKAMLGAPSLEVREISGTVVAHIEAGSGAVFVEDGGARLTDRRGRASAAVTLKHNDFIAFHKDEAIIPAGRPSSDFVAALPRQFRDQLPQRLAAFKGREKTARVDGTFSYAEVEAWINAEAPIRRQFVRTWRAKADDAAFRASLDQAMPMHPEWDPVLHPELYEPKPKPDAPVTAAAAAAAQPAAALAVPAGANRVEAPAPGPGAAVPSSAPTETK